jgi:hypothetical protein
LDRIPVTADGEGRQDRSGQERCDEQEQPAPVTPEACGGMAGSSRRRNGAVDLSGQIDRDRLVADREGSVK